jgi:hypothetical protein
MKAIRFSFSRGVALAVLLLGAGCNRQNQDARVEKMQAELDETQKELEAMKQKGERHRPGAEQRSGEPAQAGHSGTAAPTGVAADLAASKAAAKKAIEENRAAIASNKSAIDENRTGISSNKSAIDANRSAIDVNRQGVATAQATADEAKRMAAPAPTHTIPAGTPMTVRTTSVITTKTAATGSLFEGSLEEPLTVDGYTVADKGAVVEGIVTNADPGGRVKGVASISVSLRSLVTNDGRRMPLRTDVIAREAKKSTSKDALKIGIASGIGAAIGAIAGGGKGAAIGAGAGAATGTGVTLATRGEAAEIPSETVLNFKLTEPSQIQELKK